ncbi:hypothetical protein [Cyclobacterium jeungdonense]|uniref:Biopterin-dependent aromatic amino acid hydroxylase family profile domain-containing protein n=1 Tax=Cyclobacterium jeungdonense TaxID=708087 RepID=A0ABT8C9C7_9BACT|nr:hypothetical protein [Cyclobacterium jeungdonense]MDN3688428.1 hypothetical protein [Cyclobacterium jeungdonense]
MAANYSTKILSDPRLKHMQQEYEKYTAEDFQVWKILFERQYKNLPDAAFRKFLDGLELIGFSSDRIAD